MSEKINEGELCEGPSDPRSKKCGVWGQHEWGYESESGFGKDDRAYPVCKKCGLICRMSNLLKQRKSLLPLKILRVLVKRNARAINEW